MNSPIFGADVRVEKDQVDPPWKGRKMSLVTCIIRKDVVEGNVTWAPTGKREYGFVCLSTSNSPAYLSL